MTQKRLFTSVGGKLTSARQDAALIVDAICKQASIQANCSTFGKPFPWLTVAHYPTLLTDIIREARQLGIDEESATWLVKRHGERSQKILTLCKEDSSLKQRIKAEHPFIFADLVFCAQHEMVCHLDDLLSRRLRLSILTKLTSAELQTVAMLAGNILNWDNARINEEIDRYHDRQYRDATT